MIGAFLFATLSKIFRPFLVLIYKLHLKSHARRLALGIHIKNPFLYLMRSTSISSCLLISLGILVVVANAQHRNSDVDFSTPHNIASELISQNDEMLSLSEEGGAVLPIDNEYSPLSAVKSSQANDVAEFDDTKAVSSADIAFNSGALIKPILPTTLDRRAAPNTIQEYVIQDGDTLGTIAQKFGLKIATLTSANDVRATSLLQIGKKLTIPPIDGLIYHVKRGDTVQKIANIYSSDIDKILAFNNLRDGSDIAVGQLLILPEGVRPMPADQSPTTKKTLLAKIKNIFTPSKADEAVKNTISKISGMIWPTTARRITQYFSWRHTGVDIAGPISNKIFAAADGTVLISGWQRGYGNTLLISHPNGLKTRYGHASKLFVSAGEHVTKGEVIAMVGSTGHSTGPHLHFEVFAGSKRVNPLSYVR